MTTNYFKVNTPICKFECPPDAKAVFLKTIKNQVYDLTSIPRYVEHVKFGDYFNQSIEKSALHEEIQSLEFGCDFNQPIEKGALPEALQLIYFGYLFNQPIEEGVLPEGLKSIMFECDFNQRIEKDVLPEGLQTIKFGGSFNQPIEKDVLPAGLQSIIFDGSFNQLIDNIPDKTKLYLYNIPSKITHSYTLYRYHKSVLEKLIDNKKVGEIYTSKINNRAYYMVDVEITKPEINNQKIIELINQLKIELDIL